MVVEIKELFLVMMAFGAVGGDFTPSGCTGSTVVGNPDGSVFINTTSNIEDYMFYGCSNFNSVVLSTEATVIGTAAFFACLNMETILLSEHTTLIKANAFTNCVKIHTINLPENVVVQGLSNGYMFTGSACTNLFVPASHPCNCSVCPLSCYYVALNGAITLTSPF